MSYALWAAPLGTMGSGELSHEQVPGYVDVAQDPSLKPLPVSLASGSGKFQNHLLKCLQSRIDKPLNVAPQRPYTAPTANDVISNVKSEAKKGQKRKRNVEEWKKVKKSRNYNAGVGRKIREPCSCWRKCTSKITDGQRKKLFDHFWSLAYGKKRRKYIVAFVKQMPIARRRSFSRNPRRQSTNHYCLPKEGVLPKEDEMVSVCQKFFLGTFDISDKVLRYNMSKPEPSADSPTVSRTPPNKTKLLDVEFAVQHLHSLCSERKVSEGLKKAGESIPSGLSVRKMYLLYKSLCASEQRKPVGEHIYRSEYRKLLSNTGKVKGEETGIEISWRSPSAQEMSSGNMAVNERASEQITSILHRCEDLRTFPPGGTPLANMTLSHRYDPTRMMAFSDWNVADSLTACSGTEAIGEIPPLPNRTRAENVAAVRSDSGFYQQVFHTHNLSHPFTSGLESHKSASWDWHLKAPPDCGDSRDTGQDLPHSRDGRSMPTSSKPLKSNQKIKSKRTRNMDQWKKVKKSRSYNLGEGRKLRAPCTCWRKCGSLIAEEQRQKLFDHFWGLACGEKRRKYIVAFVRQMPPARKRVLHSQRLSTNHYWLPKNGVSPNDDDMIIVCQKFFLGTFDVSDKFLRYNMSKPDLGASIPPTQRIAPNKTKPEDVKFAVKHMQSFSSSRSCQESTQGEVENFPADLSVRKMYQQYKLLCEREGRKPVGEHIYRAECRKLFDMSKKTSEPTGVLANSRIPAISCDIISSKMATQESRGVDVTTAAYVNSYHQDPQDWPEGRSRMSEAQIAALLSQWPKYS